MSLFGTAGIRGSVAERVTPELALAVGRAAGVEADELTGGRPTFVVGRDGRETGPALAAAVEAGLESAGCDVRRVGVVPTPTLAYASRGRRGVMITASHNPPADNGIKCFAGGVEYDRDAEERIEALVEESPPAVPWDRWGDSADRDVLDTYREDVADYARGIVRSAGDEPLDGLRVAIDCGNGMGSVATPQVLRTLGADVVGVNASVDGHFPARESKPTPETLTDFRAFLADAAADGGTDAFDFGLAHDGDADRIVVLTPEGDVVHEDTVVAILAEHYVRESAVGDPVMVTTPNASARIDERVAAAGGRTERVRLGALHEGIERERRAGRDDTSVVFAAEPWKHIHTGFGGWIDGVTSAAVFSVLVAQAGDLGTLRVPVAERPYRKVSVACPDDEKPAAMAAVRERLPATFPDGAVDTDYGVRIDMPDGSWVLVRPSGTEPYVRVYAESENVDAIVTEAVDVVESAVEDA